MFYEDDMKVRCVSYTRPCGEFQNLNTQEYLAAVARVSNPSNQFNKETSEKLLLYCLKNKHWSVFEQVDFTYEITTTRDIGRQILRHNGNVQEFSQRYSNPTELGLTLREARLQDTKNRQNSIETDNLKIIEDWEYRQRQVIDITTDTYEWAILNGIAKEQARAVLPEGLTLSVLYLKKNLRDWIFYCLLRMKNGTQKEHSMIAQAIWNDLKQNHVPFIAYLKETE